ncbi:LIC_11883 family protein [Leptospira kmetyi]|uniref:LIC_11883 family protein n=1 Tax=Leptospira kmetyi TaxID=408139 RepID=UPI0003905DCC|nr:hypothetical protein [Leptospira kmetyi]EQA55285.1 hypothetical protein LEP1GSC052_1412 [Leptospira kmetyi serovar Malaysia str. Bejo-Iso9]
MRRLRNIISTKMEKGIFTLFRTFSFLILFLFLNVSVSAEEPSWKEYSLRELIGRLKYYTYAKVAQSLRREYPASQEQVWENSPCSISIPELPGPFFCGLLKQQSPSTHASVSSSDAASTTSSLSPANATTASANSPSPNRGLNPNPGPLKEYKNIQLYSGTTISGKNVAQIGSEENPGESLRAFYLNNGQLSHYEFQDRILIFDWSGSKLNAILEVKVDPILRPLSGREILFP